MPFSEAELKAIEMAALGQGKDPRSRRLMAEAVKLAIPDYQFPADIQSEDRINALLDERLKPVLEENKELKNRLDKAQSDSEWKAQLAAVKRELGWTEKQLGEFLKDFGEKYKESAPVSLVTLAKAFEHENAPLVPSQSNNVRGFWGPMGDTEKEWRTAVRNPSSDFMKAVRSGNQRKKKEIKNKWWNQSAQEWQEQQGRP